MTPNTNQASAVNVLGAYTRAYMFEGAEVSGNWGFLGPTAVYWHAVFTMNGGDIINNFSSTNAGGVNIVHIQGGSPALDGGHFIMNGGNISNNEALMAGGGVSLSSGTFNLWGGNIGGATPALGNTAGSSGGGVIIHNALVTFIMHDGNIQNNIATQGMGGGMMANTGSVITMHGGTIQNNTATGASGAGGGIAMNTNSILNFNGGTIQTNTAGWGGGIAFFGGTQGHFAGATQKNIRNNTGNHQGGGIYNEGGTVNINGTTDIYNNHRASAGGGAGIQQMSGTIRIGQNGTVNIRNHSTVNGAAVHVSGGTVYMYASGNIYYNETTNLGTPGGVHVAQIPGETAFFRMRGGVIRNNEGTQGGGVRVNLGSFIMEGAATKTIRNNHADDGGGVLIAQAGASFQMDAGPMYIQSNTIVAGGMGAGILQNGGTVTMNTGATIRRHNITAVGGIAGGNTGTDAGAASPGSAVHILGGTFTMNGGYMTSNRTNTANTGGAVSVQNRQPPNTPTFRANLTSAARPCSV